MREHLRNAVLTGFAIQGANFISGVLVARLLGPELRGELGIVFLWPFLASTVAMSSLNDTALYLVLNKRLDASEAYSGAIFIGLIGASVCIGLFFGLMLFGVSEHSVSVLMFVYSSIAVPHSITLIAGSVFLATSKQRYWNVVRAWAHGVYAVSVGLLYLHGTDAISGSTKITIVTLVSLAANWSGIFATYAMLRFVGVHLEVPRRAKLALIAHTAMKIHLGNAPQIVAGFLDQIVFSVSLSAEEFGLILVASSVVRAGLFITSGLSQSLTPQLYGRSRRRAASSCFNGGLVLLILASGYMVVFDIVAFMAIPTIYGHAYDESKFFLLVLGFQVILIPLRAMLLNGVRALGHHTLVASVEWVNIIIVLALVPAVSALWGPYWGAGVLIAISLLACIAWLLLYLRLTQSVRKSAMLIGWVELKSSAARIARLCT